MKKTVFIISAVMALNCSSALSAPPINKNNEHQVIHQDNNKIPPKPHPNKKRPAQQHKKMQKKPLPEHRLAQSH